MTDYPRIDPSDDTLLGLILSRVRGVHTRTLRGMRVTQEVGK